MLNHKGRFRLTVSSGSQPRQPVAFADRHGLVAEVPEEDPSDHPSTPA